MPALELLVLSGNKLNTLPEGLCQFTTLRQLFAGRNHISTLPIAIGKLQKLVLLDLSCNGLTALPEELSSLVLLRELNLSYNKLQEIPASLSCLKGLHVLSLNHNHLREVPAELRLLREGNCYHMDLDDNLQDLQWYLQKKGGKKNGGKGKERDEKKNAKRIKIKHRTVGTSETIGKRPSMEDTITIRLGFNGTNHEDFYAVFDGHAGRRAAVFARENFHSVLAEQLNLRAKGEKEEKEKEPKKRKIPRRKTTGSVGSGLNAAAAAAISRPDEGEAIASCLRNSFIEIDEQMKDYRDGATAVVAMVSKRLRMAFVANVGDARAVLGREGKAVPLTIDHTPKLPSEEKRIRDLNGYITSNRINGIIAISRSLGDASLKPLVSAEPGMAVVPLLPEDRFLILACDGCWDVMDNQQAVEVVERELQASNDPVKAAVRLKETAYWCGSADNISVIVVRLKKYLPSVPKKEKSSKEKESGGVGAGDDEDTEGDSSSSTTPRKRGGTESLYEHMSRGARSMTNLASVAAAAESQETGGGNNKKTKKGKGKKEKSSNHTKGKEKKTTKHAGDHAGGTSSSRSGTTNNNNNGTTRTTPTTTTTPDNKVGGGEGEDLFRERRSSSFSEEVLLPRAPSDVMESEGDSAFSRKRSHSVIDSNYDIPSVFALQNSPSSALPQALEGAVVVTRERARSIGK